MGKNTITADLHIDFNAEKNEWTVMCLDEVQKGSTLAGAIGNLNFALRPYEKNGISLDLVLTPKSNTTLLEVRRFKAQGKKE